MDRQEKEWLLMYMMSSICWKTLYLLTQNRAAAAVYAQYTLEKLKDYRNSWRMKPYQSVIKLLTDVSMIQ